MEEQMADQKRELEKQKKETAKAIAATKIEAEGAIDKQRQPIPCGLYRNGICCLCVSPDILFPNSKINAAMFFLFYPACIPFSVCRDSHFCTKPAPENGFY